MDATKMLALGLAVLALAIPGQAAVSAPWVNGDFELGDATWSLASTTAVGDADGDGDMEAVLQGCGDGTWQLSRGVTKGVLPAAARLAFEVERGELYIYSFRMIMLRAADPAPYANNLFSLDPTGTLQPDWFDDHVLAWEDWQTAGPLSGQVVLDASDATAYNIPGWEVMTPEQRQLELLTMTHMTLVVYACARGFEGGATLDDVAWDV